ncbi:MAG: autotransporter assembly complex family protein [Candidatus Berkiellales bacterium]
MKILSKVVLFYLIFIAFATAFAKAPPIEVKIQGVSSSEIKENIEANLAILSQMGELTHDPAHQKQYLERARQEIIQAIQPFGYYEASIDDHLVTTDHTYKAIFTINLGQPIRIAQINFILEGEGRTDLALQRIMVDFPLTQNDIFDHDSYEQGKKAVLSTAISAGFLNASFSEHRVEVDIDNHTSKIFLTLNTGVRYHFGPVTFDKTYLSTQLLERYLSFKPNDIYSPEKILSLQSQLSQSEYFSFVNVKALSEETSNIVPVLVELKDAKPNQYIIGGGYGTDTGLRGKASWTRRQINQWGHRFSATARLAEIYSMLELDYVIPGKHPNTDYVKIKGGFFEDEFSAKRSKIYETGINEVREIYGWQRNIGLSYLHEQFNAFLTNDIVQSKLILPSITFIQTKRDDIASPTHGRRIEITFRGSVDALFSDTSFFQTYLQLRWLHALTPTLKLLARTEFGATFPEEVERLPLSQRFYAGGDLSLRGFAYRSLPFQTGDDGQPHPVGGTYLAVGSIELAKTIKAPIAIFTFLDVGNAFRPSDNELEAGTGIGVEWITRLGPIKVAVAKPITQNSDSWRIHASFGPEL